MLETVLQLLWDEIRESAEKGHKAWVNALRPKQGRYTSRDFNQGVIDRIREFSDILPDAGLPIMPSSFSEKRSVKGLIHAERSWTFLILQSLATIEGNAGLFCDTQALLFFSDLHFLLPNLKEQGCDSEHDCLLNAMYMHLWLVWRNEHPQLLYLGSQLMDYLGQKDIRDRMLLESFYLTSPEDHTFLTKAQDLWSNLIEERRLKEAMNFLFLVKGRSLPSQREEIDQMVDYTMSNRQEQPA